MTPIKGGRTGLRSADHDTSEPEDLTTALDRLVLCRRADLKRQHGQEDAGHHRPNPEDRAGRYQGGAGRSRQGTHRCLRHTPALPKSPGPAVWQSLAKASFLWPGSPLPCKAPGTAASLPRGQTSPQVRDQPPPDPLPVGLVGRRLGEQPLFGQDAADVAGGGSRIVPVLARRSALSSAGGRASRSQQYSKVHRQKAAVHGSPPRPEPRHTDPPSHLAQGEPQWVHPDALNWQPCHPGAIYGSSSGRL